MRRRIFAGPSINGVADRPVGIEFHPPAGRGDLVEAVSSGVGWIGLIDGYFGSCASVWHKEILFALAEGCHVWGAASMGALRAAECQTFGMRPVGAIAAQFANGTLNDDAAVAIVHGPPEIDYLPFTEALVDVRATAEALVANEAVEPGVADELVKAARELHFSERTLEALLSKAVRGHRGLVSSLGEKYEIHRVRAKQRDALQLIREMAHSLPIHAETGSWTLSPSASLRSLVSSHVGPGRAGSAPRRN